jgi:hypothetical protein
VEAGRETGIGPINNPSYRQICEITGWSYTKVNRCLTEGRRSFLERVAGIESGAECERLSPLLSAFADGEATAVEMTKLRPHLRSCLACRAALRAFRELPHRAAEVVPVPVAAEAGPGIGDAIDAVWRWGESAAAWMQERIGLAAAKAQTAVEASNATKAAAVAASATALAGGAVLGSLDGERAAGPVAGDERVLEPAAPAHRLPRSPQAIEAVELEAPAPPEPIAAEPVDPSPAELAPVEPAPVPAAPSRHAPTAATGRSRQFPERVTTPVANPGESALAGVDEEERETAIDPMTEPSEPMVAPGPRAGD